MDNATLSSSKRPHYFDLQSGCTGLQRSARPNVVRSNWREGEPPPRNDDTMAVSKTSLAALYAVISKTSTE